MDEPVPEAQGGTETSTGAKTTEVVSSTGKDVDELMEPAPSPEMPLPPPPRSKKQPTTAPLPPRNPSLKAKVIASAVSSASALPPALREEAIRGAVAKLIEEQDAAAALDEPAGRPDAAQHRPSAASSGPPPQYDPPSWAGVPSDIAYTMEVIKGGSVVQQCGIADKDHYTLGRSPAADFVLEHPSASRLHAVVQYKRGTGEAFLYDAGSTHGTFINKTRLSPRSYHPLRVGDTIKVGQSSRLYLFGGPAEAMPAETLTPLQKKQLAALESLKRSKERDSDAAQAQMELVLSRGGGASWGMRDDLEEAQEADAGARPIDWREFAEKHGLTDKMQKLADRIRKREWTIKNLRTECERIQAKERQEGGLTPGQASTLVRNEQAIDKLNDEVEELDETLNEAVADSLSDRKKDKSKAAADKKRRAAAAARRGSDDEAAEASSDEDEFYDRTGGRAVRRRTGAGSQAGAGGAGGQQPAVESAETLHVKREALLDEQKRLQAAVAEEEAAQQALQQQQQAGGGAAGSVAAAAGPAAVAAGGEDSLDAFMSGVEVQLEESKVQRLKAELAEVEAGLARTERLLRIADPDGWYQPKKVAGPAAAAAKAAALKRLEAQRQQLARSAALQARKEASKAEAGAPETEEEEEEQATAGRPPAAAGPASTSADEAASTSGRPAGQAAAGAPAAAGGAGGAAGEKASAAAAAAPAAAAAAAPAAGDAGGAGGWGLQKRSVPKHPLPPVKRAQPAAAAPQPPGAAGGPSNNSGGEAPKGAAAGKGILAGLQQAREADQRASASLSLLSRARARAAFAEEEETATAAAAAAAARKAEEEAEAAAAAAWAPPTGQKGDGRTSLNDRYGY